MAQYDCPIDGASVVQAGDVLRVIQQLAALLPRSLGIVLLNDGEILAQLVSGHLLLVRQDSLGDIII
ncbi:MAG: hypothetical protein JSW37_14810 [Anaerolineales bacterium]|nr:MAG: hypothetical protein JSW37_14810 [Anaerolineales bacterium]